MKSEIIKTLAKRQYQTVNDVLEVFPGKEDEVKKELTVMNYKGEITIYPAQEIIELN